MSSFQHQHPLKPPWGYGLDLGTSYKWDWSVMLKKDLRREEYIEVLLEVTFIGRLPNGSRCLRITLWFCYGFTKYNKKECKHLGCDWLAMNLECIVHHSLHLCSCHTIFVFCLICYSIKIMTVHSRSLL